MNFEGKCVLITGASRGIGRSCAIEFAKRGARVGINYRNNRKAAKRTLAECKGDGHQLFCADVGEAEAVAGLMENFLQAFDRIDILVNNAGIFKPHPLCDTDYDAWQSAWQETFRVNLFATSNLCWQAAQHMRNGGRIVNVSSRGAFRGEPTAPAYGASKAAMNAMGQSLAKHLAKDDIFVGTVAPGFTETDMALEGLTDARREKIIADIPMGRMAKAEEVAMAVLFLASEGAEFCTGTIIDVNGASYLR